MNVNRTRAVVVGAGPAGLMAAETLARAGVAVTVCERMPRPARKLLLAGRGGLNLTHVEGLGTFLARYREAEPRLTPLIQAFPPEALRAWCEGLGQETFVGTSGRVFPRAMKTSPLLRAWLARLAASGVEFAFRHRWLGWDAAGALVFDTPEGTRTIAPPCTILALGGASWPQLGADGGWVGPLAAAGVATAPLTPANAGLRVDWSEVFASRFQGTPLKRIAISAEGETTRGEAMITAGGLEGGAVYALGPAIRRALASGAPVHLHIDLRPDTSEADLITRLERPRGKLSVSTYLRKALSLDPVGIGLLHEAALSSSQPLGMHNTEQTARLVKCVPVTVTGFAPIERAISTAGGVVLDELDEYLMLRRMPGTFVAGEMLDWDAPTGGYLLQACFATGRAAGLGALAFLTRHNDT